MKNSGYSLVMLLLFLCFLNPGYSQSRIEISSPDGHIKLDVTTDEQLTFRVFYDSILLLDDSKLSMNIGEGEVLGLNPKIKKKIISSFSDTIIPFVPEKFKTIPINYNQLLLSFRGDYKVCFRVFNNGIGWRFETSFKDEIIVNKENTHFNLADGSQIYFPEEESFFSHNERYYHKEPVNLISVDRFCSLPALVKSPEGINILITETALNDYPGMWLRGTGSNGLRSLFPGVAEEEEQTSDRDVEVSRYADHIAQTSGTRKFPWRILAIEKEDAGLITNQLSYILADTCRLDSTDWIKPGKVAWDWWNALNIYGVDFKSGVNTDTYKYYIDFASEYGIEYIIMDEGWYHLEDLLDVIPEINMREIVGYAHSKNVGVILWVVWKTLENQWERAFDQFEAWGIKGIKVDFMQRDDQAMVNFYRRVADEAAGRKLLVDFHGSYKPAGLRREYPNVISREGVKGLEQSKWSDKNTPDHNLLLPFIRMVAGPMDFTPGAMINANSENFRAIYQRPMSMGTRCHQLAMYVVFESPLQMLCDNPSNYKREPECMEFLSAVPTVWDTTVVLSASIGEQVIVARKHNNKWFIGAMTNREPRQLETGLNFLGNGKFNMKIWKDGLNADRFASDFKMESKEVKSNDRLLIDLAPGGGWAAILEPVNDSIPD
ncbi:MAG: glycoside hydrolase family 97 protein [Bacteroidales bacterium]|nr:glycoside hydrolase family 97 protein [Bacteroidales bacterium]